MILWLTLFTFHCESEPVYLRYEIRYDSQINDELKIKENILSIKK